MSVIPIKGLKPYDLFFPGENLGCPNERHPDQGIETISPAHCRCRSTTRPNERHPDQGIETTFGQEQAGSTTEVRMSVIPIKGLKHVVADQELLHWYVRMSVIPIKGLKLFNGVDSYINYARSE